MILSFGGKTPRDEGAVFVAANATVLGDVTLGKGTNIWYGAVLRGDEGTLVLGENCNVQDNAVLHCDPGGQVLLGKNVTVGHCALAHGCTVGENSLIGMHATLLNHSVVGKNCIIIISIRFTFFKCDCICRTGRQTVTKAIAKIIAH